MFFPMSCTSPLTVASSTLPADEASPPFISASMCGVSFATAFFITLALLTTCGRNILPDPNRSPTTFIPSISGPSMTRSALSYCGRASSTSSSMNVSMPFTRACFIRLTTSPSRHSGCFVPSSCFAPFIVEAYCSSLSVASFLRFITTSSVSCSSCGSTEV